jgi:hypothetical protein
MTKLEFLPEPYMILRLGNIQFIYVACFSIKFSEALLMPYERFVMLLKLGSHTHHPHMHYSYTWDRRKNMPFHLDPPKKCFTPTLGVNTKNIPLRISPNKCANVLLAISQKFRCRKEACGYAKAIHKKIKKKSIAKK